MKTRQFRGDDIGVVANVPVLCLDCKGELLGIVESWVEESSFAVHLRNGHVGVPVGNGTPARPGVITHTSQAEGGREEGGSRLAVRSKSFAVVYQFRVIFARPPGGERLFQLVLIDAD